MPPGWRRWASSRRRACSCACAGLGVTQQRDLRLSGLQLSPASLSSCVCGGVWRGALLEEGLGWWTRAARRARCLSLITHGPRQPEAASATEDPTASCSSALGCAPANEAAGPSAGVCAVSAGGLCAGRSSQLNDCRGGSSGAQALPPGQPPVRQRSAAWLVPCAAAVVGRDGGTRAAFAPEQKVEPPGSWALAQPAGSVGAGMAQSFGWRTGCLS